MSKPTFPLKTKKFGRIMWNKPVHPNLILHHAPVHGPETVRLLDLPARSVRVGEQHSDPLSSRDVEVSRHRQDEQDP